MLETAGQTCVFSSVMSKIPDICFLFVCGYSAQACGRTSYILHVLSSSAKNGHGLFCKTQSPSSSIFKYCALKAPIFIRKDLDIRSISRCLKMGLVVLQQLAQSRHLTSLKTDSCCSWNCASKSRGGLRFQRVNSACTVFRFFFDHASWSFKRGINGDLGIDSP